MTGSYGDCGNEKILLSCTVHKKGHCITTVFWSIFFSVCVQAPLQRKQPLSMKHELLLQCQCLLHSGTTPSLHFCKELPVCHTQLQDGLRGITVSPRWWGGHFWGYISSTPVTLWELLLPILAISAHRRHPSKAAKWYDWEITHHLWGNSVYSDSFGRRPGMMCKSRACPCRVLTAPLI